MGILSFWRDSFGDPESIKIRRVVRLMRTVDPFGNLMVLETFYMICHDFYMCVFEHWW